MMLLSVAAPALSVWGAPNVSPPRCSLSLSLASSSAPRSTVSVRRAETGNPSEVGTLSDIIVAAFYGEHEAWHGPIAWAQRRVIQADIFTDLTSRISYYERARRRQLTHRGAVLVADSTGSSSGGLGGTTGGFVDVGLPLFDRAKRTFKLPPQPEGATLSSEHELRPYVSNLAVSEQMRRQGVGRRLMAECEAEVKGWDGEHQEIWLEVSLDNQPAIAFYQTLGYEQVRFQHEGSRPGDCLRSALYKPRLGLTSPHPALTMPPRPPIESLRLLFAGGRECWPGDQKEDFRL